MESENKNFNCFCRTCFKEIDSSPIKINVFEVPNLIEKLIASSNLPITENDGLSEYLCDVCHNKVEEFYLFRQICLKTVERFIQLNKNKQIHSNLNANENQGVLVEDFELTTVKVEPEPEFIEIKENKRRLQRRERRRTNRERIQGESSKQLLDKIKQIRSDVEKVEIEPDVDIIKENIQQDKKPEGNSESNAKVNEERHRRRRSKSEKSQSQESTRRLRRRKINQEVSKDKNDDQTQHMEPSSLSPRPNAQQSYICDHCGKLCPSLNRLKLHMYMHLHNSPYECEVCKKQYSSKTNLEDHRIQHYGVRKFACTYCPYKAFLEKTLRRHMQRHLRAKTIKCKQCDYSTWNINILKKHENAVHLGIKKYECKHCGRRFTKGCVLKNHVMTHTGEKPHQCPICGHGFIQKTILSIHMRKRHNINMKDLVNKINDEAEPPTTCAEQNI